MFNLNVYFIITVIFKYVLSVYIKYVVLLFNPPLLYEESIQLK